LCAALKTDNENRALDKMMLLPPLIVTPTGDGIGKLLGSPADQRPGGLHGAAMSLPFGDELVEAHGRLVAGLMPGVPDWNLLNLRRLGLANAVTGSNGDGRKSRV
jgi:hypothetical protein